MKAGWRVVSLLNLPLNGQFNLNWTKRMSKVYIHERLEREETYIINFWSSFWGRVSSPKLAMTQLLLAVCKKQPNVDSKENDTFGKLVFLLLVQTFGKLYDQGGGEECPSPLTSYFEYPSN